MLVLSQPLPIQSVGLLDGFPILLDVDFHSGNLGLAIDEAAELGYPDCRQNLRLPQDVVALRQLLGHRMREEVTSKGGGGGARASHHGRGEGEL